MFKSSMYKDRINEYMFQAIKLNRYEFVNLLLKSSSINLDAFLNIEILKDFYTQVIF
jgi:hypothetical protein